ncbi:unnamed protein product [Urochloa decumbens]|uniref:F-box domain-containing protein n=1 Tax=Urochloa decumbens TaxID=240449 RepID=A0ABC8WDZ9_9POAL
METFYKAGIISLRRLAIHPRNLFSLIFRVLHKLLRHSTGLLLKKFGEDGCVHPPSVGTSLGRMPELPQDILMDIFATLEIPDLVRVGSVCSAWRSAYNTLRENGQYKRSQTPCLLYTSESAGENVVCLYSLGEKKTYKLTLPEPPIRSRFLIGSSHGWLVTVDDRSEMHLVNPITGEQITLPSVITIEHVNPIVDKSGVVRKYELSYHTARQMFYKPSDPEYVKLHVKPTFDKFEVVRKYEPTERKVYYEPSVFAVDELREHLHYKAFVFPEISKGSYIVALIHNPLNQLSFARAGDGKWTWLPPYTDYEDCSYKNGLLYAITIMVEIHAFHLSGSVIMIKTIMGMTDNVMPDSIYMVHAPWGDLLNVWRIVDDEDANFDSVDHVLSTNKIKINKVDIRAKRLEEFKCMHDHVLFLGHNQSLCLSTKDHPQLRANHAYFTDDYDLYIHGYKNSRRDLGVFNLKNNISEELVSPQPWSNWPTPMWITLSLAKMNELLAYSYVDYTQSCKDDDGMSYD